MPNKRRPVRQQTRLSPRPQATTSPSSGSRAATETWAHVHGIRCRVRSAPALVYPADGPLLKSQGQDSCPPPRDYEVGYGKPPKDSRFKSGRSGNPRGRPKGSKNLLTLIHAELDRPIAVREDGRSRKVPARAALSKRLLQKALSGHDRSIELLFKLAGVRADHRAVAPVEAADDNAQPLTAGDRAILEDFRRQIIEEHELATRAVGADEVDEQGGSA